MTTVVVVIAIVAVGAFIAALIAAELADLNGKIGKLSFYLNENADELDGGAKDSMLAQIGAMYDYQDKLERRIRKGWY